MLAPLATGAAELVLKRYKGGGGARRKRVFLGNIRDAAVRSCLRQPPGLHGRVLRGGIFRLCFLKFLGAEFTFQKNKGPALRVAGIFKLGLSSWQPGGMGALK